MPEARIAGRFALACAAGLIACAAGASGAGAQTHCFRADRLPGGMMLHNFCSTAINVTWRDQGYCANGGGCMSHIAPNSRSSASIWRGSTNYCVCWNYDRCCKV